jgi:hypothetical protein
VEQVTARVAYGGAQVKRATERVKMHGVLICSPKGGGTLVPWLRNTGMGGFAEELHFTGPEPPEGFKGDCAERIWGALVVGKVVLALVCVPKSNCMARGALSGMDARSSLEMDEQGCQQECGEAWGAGRSESPSVAVRKVRNH